MNNLRKSTNFSMDRILRDNQNENKQLSNKNNNINFWPFISSPSSSSSSSSSSYNNQLTTIPTIKNNIQLLSPSSFNYYSQFQFLSSPPSLILNSPLYFINNSFNTTTTNLDLFQQKLNLYYYYYYQQQQQQQITPLSLNTKGSINTSEYSSEYSSNNNSNCSTSNINTSIKYLNNLKSTFIPFNSTKENKKQEKISSSSYQIFKTNNELIKETPKTTKLINNNKKAKCDVCGKLFGRPWLLNGHKRIHDGKKPFKCEWIGCSRSFADRSNCRAHERTHKPEKPFICTNCGKAFKLKSYLSKHLRAKVCRQNK